MPNAECRIADVMCDVRPPKRRHGVGTTYVQYSGGLVGASASGTDGVCLCYRAALRRHVCRHPHGVCVILHFYGLVGHATRRDATIRRKVFYF